MLAFHVINGLQFYFPTNPGNTLNLLCSVTYWIRYYCLRVNISALSDANNRLSMHVLHLKSSCIMHKTPDTCKKARGVYTFVCATLLPIHYIPDIKLHGANMGLTWVLSARDGPHVGPMNLAIRDVFVSRVSVIGVLPLSLLVFMQCRATVGLWYQESVVSCQIVIVKQVSWKWTEVVLSWRVLYYKIFFIY